MKKARALALAIIVGALWFTAAPAHANTCDWSCSPTTTTPPPTTVPPTTTPPSPTSSTTPPPTTPPTTTPPPSTSTTPPPTTTEPPDPTPTCIPRPHGDHVSPNPNYCTPDTGASTGSIGWAIFCLAALGIVGLGLTRKRTLEV